MPGFSRLLSRLAILSALACVALAASADAQAPRPIEAPATSLTRLESDSAVRDYFLSLSRLPRRRQIVRDSLEAIEDSIRDARYEACAAAPVPAPVVRRRGLQGVIRDSGASITGTVLTSDQRPLFGANITADVHKRSVGTDTLGRFGIDLTAAELRQNSQVALRARAFGHVPHVQRLHLAPGDSVRVEFRLCTDLNRLTGVSAGTPGERPPFPGPELPPRGASSGVTVQRVGEHLVILRRGRLFTVSIANGRLAPVSAVDAFAPGLASPGATYDQLLVHGDRVIVIGRSVKYGGTEIHMFRIEPSGAIRFVSGHQLSSASRFAPHHALARIVDGRLLLYAALPMWVPAGEKVLAVVPSLGRWNEQSHTRGFEPVPMPVRVHRTNRPPRFWEDVGLHSLTSCTLGAPGLRCTSDVVVGPVRGVAHVSRGALHIWTALGAENVLPEGEPAMLFRMPFDGSPPTALGVIGRPLDAGSFHEEASGELQVVVEGAPHPVRSGAEGAAGRPFSLVRLDTRWFGDGSRSAPPQAYRALSSTDTGSLRAAFVGRKLVHGTPGAWRDTPRTDRFRVFVTPLDGTPAVQLTVPLPTVRISAVGGEALIFGTDGGPTSLTWISLGTTPADRGRMVRLARQGIDSGAIVAFPRVNGAPGGLLGFTMPDESRQQRPDGQPPRAVVFAETALSGLRIIGRVQSRPDAIAIEGCNVSCEPPYADTRALSIAGRIFALIAGELIEVELRAGGIFELNRVSFVRPPGARD